MREIDPRTNEDGAGWHWHLHISQNGQDRESETGAS